MINNEQSSPRIGTAERTAAQHALDEHLNDGRLQVEEYADRSAVAANATTAGELAALFADLPAPHPKLPGAPTPAIKGFARNRAALAGVVVTAIALIALIATWSSSGAPNGSSSNLSSTPSAIAPATGMPAASALSTTATVSPGLTSVSSAGPPPGQPIEATSYLDDLAKECGIGAATGPMAISGTQYAHGVLQWAGQTSNSFNISRRAERFHAIIGIRDDANSDVRVQFELRGDNGQQLFKSRTLGFGETESVDVPVSGILRITRA